jgi:hypothetical protein
MKAKIIVAVAMFVLSGLANAQEDGVAWDALNEEQQRVLSSFSDRWDNLEPERQKRLSMGADRWSNMTPKQRDAAQGRFSQWRGLTPDRKSRIRKR